MQILEYKFVLEVLYTGSQENSWVILDFLILNFHNLKNTNSVQEVYTGSWEPIDLANSMFRKMSNMKDIDIEEGKRYQMKTKNYDYRYYNNTLSALLNCLK